MRRPQLDEDDAGGGFGGLYNARFLLLASGGGVGVASGLYKYVTEKPEITIDTMKLRANRLLNATGEDGQGVRSLAPTCRIRAVH